MIEIIVKQHMMLIGTSNAAALNIGVENIIEKYFYNFHRLNKEKAASFRGCLLLL